MVKKDEVLFTGPDIGEQVKILLVNNLALEGVVYGKFDDVIVLQDINGNFQVAVKGAVIAMIIGNELPGELVEEEVK